MTWGDNGHARPTTEAYRNNKFWDKGKKMKKTVYRVVHLEDDKETQLREFKTIKQANDWIKNNNDGRLLAIREFEIWT